MASSVNGVSGNYSPLIAKQFIEGSGSGLVSKTEGSTKTKEEFKSQFAKKSKPIDWEKDVSSRNKHVIETKKEKI